MRDPDVMLSVAWARAGSAAERPSGAVARRVCAREKDCESLRFRPTRCDALRSCNDFEKLLKSRPGFARAAAENKSAARSRCLQRGALSHRHLA